MGDWDLDYKSTNMADDQYDFGKLTLKRRDRYCEYMRHSNPYKFQAARRRKGNLYKSKQSSTGTDNDLNKCDVEELIPEGSQAQPFVCMAMLLNFFLQKQTELLDFANSNTFEQFVKDAVACSDSFSEKFPPLHSEK